MTSPLTLEALPDVVRRHVTDVKAIDMHTHLLPPSHGSGEDSLLLFGIDELLTYRMPHELEPRAHKPATHACGPCLGQTTSLPSYSWYCRSSRLSTR